MNNRSGSYLLENSHILAERRLSLLSNLFDPVTDRIFSRIGVTTGWKCWEIGTGNGATAEILAHRVGSSGHVFATDIDLSALQGKIVPNCDFVHHDLVNDSLPQEQFDLIHARLVLVHIPQRQEVMRRIASCLSNNGVLFLEDADPALQPMACPDAVSEIHDLANHIRNGFRRLLSARGVDLAFGRTLPRMLHILGLRNVEAEVFFPFSTGAAAQLEAITIQTLRNNLKEENVADDIKIDALLSALQTNQLEICPAPLVSAWGMSRLE